ncbi:MAG: acetylornithine deacetylase, partial [Polyangiaceae bacterium]|nr:acetylornithine deacetylase [Polyangiaceae bacterium]
GLLLSGHTDTVPYDESGWDSEPLALLERDGVCYGLGTADMKGFFAAALHAVAAIDRDKLIRPLVLVGTSDEESGMDGMRALVASEPHLGAHAIIGEPTGLAPKRMHKGVMMERITLEGRAGHASDPSLGKSALEGMIAVATELLALREDLARKYRNEAFSVPHPTLNLGRIAGGDSPNRICGRCALDVDLRILPGMVVEEVRSAIEARVRAVIGPRGLRGVVEPLVTPLPPFETPLDALIARVAVEAAGAPLGSVLFGTEGPFLNAIGIETVVLGPGSIDVAHQPNENVSLADLERATRTYARIIERICMQDDALGA